MAAADEAPTPSAPPSAYDTPSISLPVGGGAIRGIGETFKTNPVTGTAAFSIPIVTSPARSDFGPTLSLAYDSGSGNGPFGFGWQLSAPSIQRSTNHRLPTYEAGTDVFALTGAEDLVPVPARVGAAPVVLEGFQVDRYRPRTEGLYARIERWS